MIKLKQSLKSTACVAVFTKALYNTTKVFGLSRRIPRTEFINFATALHKPKGNLLYSINECVCHCP